MSIQVTSTHGHIMFGDYGVTWGNYLDDIDLAGFCSISLGNFSLEFGDIDQGKPGIYVTVYGDGEITERKTIWQAK